MVAGKLGRELVAYVSVIGVLALGVLPPEHLHSRHEDGRRAEVIHRHHELHHPANDTTRVNHHDDDSAQYLSSAFTAPNPAPRVYQANQFVILALSTLQPQLEPWRRLPTLHMSVHDPPWVTSHGLRGPPSLPV